MQGLASLSEAEAAAYKESRPKYPSSWYKMLAQKTTRHRRAWDVGTGNGQAAIGVADYYKRVVATDNSAEQLRKASKHPKVTYFFTPDSMSEDELVALVGGENSLDLVIAAQAVHYFDLEKFYAVVKRVLRKQGGVIAVWVFNDIVISPAVDRVFKRLSDSTIPYRTPRTDMALAGYKTLSFPFESVGIGSEGNPLPLDLPWTLSLDGFLGYLKSWQLVVKAKQQGVDLLPQTLLNEFRAAWGRNIAKNVVYKFFMIAGTSESDDFDWPFEPPGGGYQPPIPFPPPFPPPPFDFCHMPPPPQFNYENMPPPPPPFHYGQMPPPPPFQYGQMPPPQPFQFNGRPPPPPWQGGGPNGFPPFPFW